MTVPLEKKILQMFSKVPADIMAGRIGADSRMLEFVSQFLSGRMGQARSPSDGSAKAGFMCGAIGDFLRGLFDKAQR